jgi:predicted kinase
MHTGAQEHARLLAERVRRVLSPEEMLETEFTPAMAVHTGPGFVGLAWQKLEGATELVAEKRSAQWRRRDLATLAGTLATLPQSVERPALVVLSGLPGGGKSHLAREISAHYPLAVLASDALRRSLVKRPTYSQKESARLFAAVHALLEDLLSRGVPALVDATNLKETHRQPLYEIAERTRAHLIVVEVQAADKIVRRRLNARRARQDPADISEATVEVYEMMREEAEPIEGPHIVVDTSGNNLGPAVDRIVTELVKASS